MLRRVAVIDPDNGRACNACNQLLSWSRQALAGSGVEPYFSAQWRLRDPAETTAVVRCPKGVLPEGIREEGRFASVLAVLCGEPAQVAKALSMGFSYFDDFVCCPCWAGYFEARLRRLLERQKPALRLDHLIGRSPSFQRAVDRIGPVARSEAAVLLQGETGVGKELFARAIHYNSRRAARPFVPLNCSAIPDHLFENELFGHAKGAFTDARTEERGLLGEANGGTLFLDEVDMLTPSSQAKLLRFLQDREYRPLGSTKTLEADVRVVAASNADLRELIQARQFREDLYYRLNVLPLPIPPLRERPADIPLLSEHFTARFAAQYGKGEVRIAPEALEKMSAYSWPGNVRELEGVIHQAIVFASGAILHALSIEIPVSACVCPADSKDAAMLGFERSYLVSLLTQHDGNVSHSAAASGKDRRTLQRLLRKHGIERLAFRAS